MKNIDLISYEKVTIKSGQLQDLSGYYRDFSSIIQLDIGLEGEKPGVVILQNIKVEVYCSSSLKIKWKAIDQKIVLNAVSGKVSVYDEIHNSTYLIKTPEKKWLSTGRQSFTCDVFKYEKCDLITSIHNDSDQHIKTIGNIHQME